VILGKVKYILFATISVILSLVVADLILHAAAFVSPRANEVMSVVAKYVPDERLQHRPNPGYPGHDANGFRNLHVPQTADVVALGDSQTYGTGVEADEAWPRVLESLDGRSVYSMAFGGYGPLQSLLLWDDAAALQPRVVIEGLYSGNDLYDSFTMVYGKKGKLPELKTDDKDQLEVIAQAEKSGPLNKLVQKNYRAGKKASRFEKLAKNVKDWIVEHSKVYALYWRSRYELLRFEEEKRDEKDRWKKARAYAKRHPEYAHVFANSSTKTILTPKFRLSALNLDDPRIREGQRIAYEAILRLDESARRDGARLIVLLIPTKELVFSEQAKDLAVPEYHRLVQNELRFWSETKSFLDEHSIEYIDALAPLQQQLETGVQPYDVTDDGHPNAHGHRAIAREIHSYLASGK
jgi:hypothetical protein